MVQISKNILKEALNLAKPHYGEQSSSLIKLVPSMDSYSVSGTAYVY